MPQVNRFCSGPNCNEKLDVTDGNVDLHLRKVKHQGRYYQVEVEVEVETEIEC